MTGRDDWRSQPERGSPRLLRLMLWLSRRLGRRFSRLALYPIALYFFLFAPTARRASRAYLARALNHPARTIDMLRHFLTFASTIHDRVYLLDNPTGALTIDCPHGSLFDAPAGAILIGAHLGSFEALRAIGKGKAQRRVSMLMHPDNAKKINTLLAIANPAAADDIIALGQVDSMLTAQTRLTEGHLIGMLADRSLPGDTLRLCPFLGTPAGFALGPFRVAALLKQPVYFMAGLYLGGNRYRVHFELLADFTHTDRHDRTHAIHRAQDRYVALLESHCRAYPYNWFNFYDFWAPPIIHPPESAA